MSSSGRFRKTSGACLYTKMFHKPVTLEVKTNGEIISEKRFAGHPGNLFLFSESDDWINLKISLLRK